MKATYILTLCVLIAVTFLCKEAQAEDSQALNTESALENKLYFALEDENGLPQASKQTTFDCSDKVYQMVELSNYSPGRHHLSVRWVDPNSKTRELTEYWFHVKTKETKLWAWLSLHRATGAGLMQWINPAAGLEEFIGLWNVEVRVDDKPIGKPQFEVSC